MNIKVVIPAKGTSVRVPNKNLRPFFGEKSLLEICIEKVKTLGIPVAVNSESPEILALAQRLAVQGTPTLVWADGTRTDGYVDRAVLLARLQQVSQVAGGKP